MKIDKNNANIPFASRAELVLCVALGCANLVAFAILAGFWKYELIFLALIVLVLYLAEIYVIGVHRKANMTVADVRDVHELLSQKSSAFLRDSNKPIILFNSFGTALWCNAAMRELIRDEDNPIQKNITEIFGSNIRIDANEASPFVFRDSFYTVDSFTLSESGDGIYMISLNDITELSEYKKKYNEERTAVAYVTIDNVEDVFQYVHEKFSDAVSAIDEKLKAWADSLDGIIKSYDNDKYIMFFDSVHLDNLIRDRFSILDEIRDTRVGDGVSITVSIGVSRVEGSLKSREANARDAIDMCRRKAQTMRPRKRTRRAKDNHRTRNAVKKRA